MSEGRGYVADKKPNGGMSFGNNAPVGSAGQPDKKSAKMNAIGRRIAAKRKQDSGSKNGGY